MEIRIKALPEKHSDVAASYNNVGYTYGQMGEHQKALEYKKKALEIRLVLSENQQDIVSSYNNVGYTYGQMGEHQKALEYLQKALEFYEAKFGKEPSPIYAKALKNTAFQYKSLYDEALQYYKQSYDVFNNLENRSRFIQDIRNIESEIANLKNSVHNTLHDSNDEVVFLDS